MNKRIIAAISVIVSILAGCTNNSVGDSVYSLNPETNVSTHGQTIRDETILIIGVERIHDGYPVGLKIAVLDSSTVLYSKNLISTNDMECRINQPSALVFYDFSEEVGQAINGYAIKNWLTEENYHNIVCYVTSNGGQIVSAPFYIKDCGIWYLSAAETNGGEISNYDWGLFLL